MPIAQLLAHCNVISHSHMSGDIDHLHVCCRVADVMTSNPLVVRPETNIEAAARILLEKKVRRLPVVDETGALIGMFTRGDVIKAALRARNAAKAAANGNGNQN